MMVQMDNVTQEIIGAAIEVHQHLGPGLLESAYETCLKHELQLRKLKVDHQQPLSINYKGIILDCVYRPDLIVEDQVIVEVKSVSEMSSLHEAQLLSYLKFRGGGRGLLINFNVVLLKHGIRRLIV